jgi:hypothetical protein
MSGQNKYKDKAEKIALAQSLKAVFYTVRL